MELFSDLARASKLKNAANLHYKVSYAGSYEKKLIIYKLGVVLGSLSLSLSV